MNKNVHFVNTVEKDNDEFRIYDVAFLSDNIFLSSDIIGQLIFYEIPDNEFNFRKKDVKNIYSLDDLDNLVSIYSIDTLNNEEIILGSSQGEIVYLKNNIVEEKYTNLKSEKFSKVKFISENNFISGDFKGNLTLFDKRQKSYIKIFKEQSEEITDILYETNKPNFLLSSSIDSTLCVYDINKLSLYALSDKLDEELNSMLSYKNGSYILCGSGEGNVLIFNWDWFGDFKDMIKGHPEGINDMDKFDENIFLTGAEDGLVRICTMFPKGVRGVLKNKNENKINKNKDSIKDVNKIKISKDKKNVIICSGIDSLQMFDISQIEFSKIYKPIDEIDEEDDLDNINDNVNDNDNDNESEKKEKKIIKQKKEESDEESEENEGEEFDDLEENEENEEEEDDFEEKEEKEVEEEEEEESIKEKIKEKKNNKDNDNDIDDSYSESINDNNLLNKKRKKKNSDNKSESIISSEKKEKEKNNNIEYNPNSNSNSDSDSDSDSDNSSSTKKKKSKKVKKIGKKTKSLIAKEERKAFFNDL